MEGCKLNPTLHLPTEQAATFMACKIYAVTALLMLPLFIQPKTRLVTTTMLSSRKVNPQMGQLQKVGALVILNCRGKKELLVTRFILLKVNSKALLGRVLSGLKIDATELFMVGSVLLSNWNWNWNWNQTLIFVILGVLSHHLNRNYKQLGFVIFIYMNNYYLFALFIYWLISV